ncbi:ABC transporter substrate-binding protein [Sulfuricurvum sp.]|uniref:ABC transporter substrate-binding protein n=1 Tax=Sulfuricurvum sp. TaxID=2025608 RepID=UPI002D358713|nr:ABC transporter substrate-binding protein [Sulfuricurvum sp.]HZF69759.1 ABC transporter substrate-binding protein [Sulfuricurvum sp.]
MSSLFIKLLLIISVASVSLLATVKCDRSVKDFTQKNVCIPTKMDKIAITCYGGASQEIALFMGAETIIAQPSVDRFQEFLKIYPTLKNVPSAGTFNDVNMENLLKLKPDIVFVGVTSTPTNDRIKEMSIPVFTLGIGKHRISSLLEEFLHVGAILHKEQKAKELVKYWQTNMDLIDTRISKIKPADRKRVFYTSGSGGLGSENKQWWGDEFIRASGGINVASELPMKGSVSAEVLSIWNPDIIVMSTNKSLNSPTNELINNPSFKTLKAFKNKALYHAPIGTFWWDRPSPESILGFIWLSKILYPEQMHDIDLKTETKKFYKKFYDYALSDEEYDHFFNTIE